MYWPVVSKEERQAAAEQVYGSLTAAALLAAAADCPDIYSLLPLAQR